MRYKMTTISAKISRVLRKKSTSGSYEWHSFFVWGSAVSFCRSVILSDYYDPYSECTVIWNLGYLMEVISFSTFVPKSYLKHCPAFSVAVNSDIFNSWISSSGLVWLNDLVKLCFSSPKITHLFRQFRPPTEDFLSKALLRKSSVGGRNCLNKWVIFGLEKT